MKIALDISQIVYGTGVSVYTKNLVSSLVKNFPDDEYILYGGSLRRRLELLDFARKIDQPIKLLPFSPTIADFVWNSLHTMSIDRFIGPVDMIHTSDWAEPPSSQPKLTTVHDLVPFKYPETSHRTIRQAHTKRMAWVIRESHTIIAVSQSTKSDLMEHFSLPSDRIVVIPEGVDPVYRPQPLSAIDSIKRRYKITGDYIFCLSTLEPRKNQSLLIEAFQKLRQEMPDINLVLAGKTGWGEAVEPVPGVHMLGFVPDSDKPALYSGALSYVSPSLYEGFGLTPLEAMSCGTPVVVANNSSYPEVVGEAGVLIDPNSVDDIVLGIINSINHGAKLRAQGLVQSQKFSWDKMAHETHRLYQVIYQDTHK
jgi:glycosyltransferase involved in cell wall biosynthesis